MPTWFRWLRVSHAESDSEDPVERCQKALAIRFQDPSRLRQALTHRSFLGESGGAAMHSNERMEFLGDSVLELVVNDFLYRRFPEDREGDLTKKRSLLVSRGVLARKASVLELGRFVLLSDAERESGGRLRASILADAFEAIIGAVYLDQGLEAARSFIRSALLDDADETLSDLAHFNFKSLLQEYVQSTSRTQPRYRVRSEEGPDHEKTFVVAVVVRGETLGTGTGKNKKEAEQNAAKDALTRLDQLEGSGG